MRAFVLVLAFLVLISGTAGAASFCIVGTGMPPQCLYEDISSCEDASTPPNTFCGVNPKARLYYYGSSRVCAVQSDRIAQCLFDNLSQCYRTAFQDQVVCVDRDERPDDVNPYLYVQPILDK